METTREIVVRFSFSRRQALFALAFFFIAWHPGFIGSESLTLTTYYPAPYGGYVSILTTGRTLLARDGGNVGIGTTTNLPLSKLDVRIPPGANNGVQISDDNAVPDTMQYATLGVTRTGALGDSYIGMKSEGSPVAWGMGISNDANSFNSFIVGPAAGRSVTTRAMTLTTPNGLGESTLYLGATKPSPDRMLYVPKDVRIGSAGDGNSGRLYGLCTTVSFGGGISSCGTNERITSVLPDSTQCQSAGSLYIGGGADIMQAGSWIAHTVDGCAGTMLCCRIVANNN